MSIFRPSLALACLALCQALASAADDTKDRVAQMADRLAALPTALLKEPMTDDQLADALVLATFKKFPTVEQRDNIKEHLKKRAANRKQACEDIIWAFVNTREFMQIHGFTMADVNELCDRIEKIK
jgi:hypothetical protein